MIRLIFTTLLLLSTVFANANELSTIQISASASVSATPDQAVTTINLSSLGATANEGERGMVAYTQQLISNLHQQGLDKKDFSIEHLGINSEYRYNDGQRTKIGSRSRSRLTISVAIKHHDIHNIIANLADIKSAGKNTFDVTATQYRLTDTDNLETLASIEAVEKAKNKAKAILESQQRKLGKIISIDSQANYSSPAPMRMAMQESAVKSSLPNQQAKQQTITVSVTMTYEIRE